MRTKITLTTLATAILTCGHMGQAQTESQELGEISVSGHRYNTLKEDSNQVVSKMPLKDLENPQVYNTISKELLDEQVVTDMNDALKNATGVTRLWQSTGRGGDGAEWYSMRGFSVQPTMVNGLPSVNNGAVDPANVESIQAIKGPSGTLFGSPMVSYGGLVNITTKQAYDRFGGSFSYTAGNCGLNRVTADVNTPLGKSAAVRLNAAYHEQKSFQDAGYKKSFFVAPSFRFQPTEKLTFLVNAEYLATEGANAPMWFLSRYSPLTHNRLEPFDALYKNSFTSNDLSMRNPTFNIQAQAIYQLSKSWKSQTAVSRSSTHTNGYYQYLWDLADGDSFYRYISKRNGETNTTDIQQNFIGDFQIGKMRNRLVVGLDYFQQQILNSSSGWVGNGIVSLGTGDDSGDLTRVGVDALLLGSTEGVSTASTQVMSAYFSDVINLLPSLSAMVSLRLDRFQGSTAYWSTDEIEDQWALSPKFGLVYQPIKDKLSVFGNYMNGFVNVAPVEVADADGTNVRMKTLEPEHANQYEFGVKSDFFKHRISATASYYHILVSNKSMTDPENINNTIQGGQVESQGVEMSLVANPVKGLHVVAGYSYNQSEVTKDSEGSGYLGFRPEEAGPQQLINFWVSYTVPVSKVKGLGVGFGGNAASEHLTLNRDVTGTFTLPAYQVFNASLFYTHKRFSVTAKVDNLLNAKYYSGWSTVTPQQLRSVSLKLTYNL